MHSKKPKLNSLLISLCVLIFIDSMSTGIIFPIMPELFLDPQYGFVSNHSWLSSGLLYGLAFALFPLAGFFSKPFLGKLSDQFGRRKVLLWGIFGISISDLLACLSIILQSPYLFLFSRVIMGFFAGAYVIADAVIADFGGSTAERMRRYRWVMLAAVIGFVLGPVIGSSAALVTGSFALTIPFLIAFILSCLNWLLLIKTFPNSQNNKTNQIHRVKDQYKAIFFVFMNKPLRGLVLSYAFYQFGAGIFLQSLSLFLSQAFNYSTGDIGIFFTIMALGLGVNALVIQPILTRYIQTGWLILITMIIMAFLLCIQGVALLLHIDVRPTIWIATFLFYFLMPLVNTGVTSVYSEQANDNEQGQAMGSLGQVQSLTLFGSGIWVGYMVLTHESISLLTAGGCVLISAVLLSVKLQKSPTK